MSHPTGEQYELVLGANRAVITQVAAAIRELTVDGTHIVEPYAATVVHPFGAGTVLVPWPNRVRDGEWMLGGEKQLLDITEPELTTALHGLLRDRPYDVVERTANSVTLGATVFPTRGYPFEVYSTVRYELRDDGILVTHRLTTVGDDAAPVAVGAHPFLRIGDEPTENLRIVISAGTRFETDAQLIPIAENPVDGTAFDLRAGGVVGALTLDDAFGSLETIGGEHRTVVTAPDGRSVELWQHPDFAYLQAFVTRIFPRGGGAPVATALAVEPMTAPPDALNSGKGLRWLEPGATWELSWGIRYSGARA
jgi:aldose 1-epimerase